MTTPISPFRMDDFQRHTLATDQNSLRGIDGLRFPLLGLFGEVGSLLSALKKKQRDRASYIGYEESVIEEFGDVLWYFANVAARANVELSSLAQRVHRANPNADHELSSELGSFQHLRAPTDAALMPIFEHRLIQLAGRVGRLMDDVANNRVEHNPDALTGHLVDILRALVAAAREANVDLDDAAQRNILKTRSRWPAPEDRGHPPLFDNDDDPEERLPRRIVMDIAERGTAQRRYVRLRCNGITIGDRLTDNKADEDDYRFHDVFHLGYAAILGWSPVTRALFKVKRKSKPRIDETEDGARASLIEEGIATWIFSHARKLQYFDAITALDYPLLKTIQAHVQGYEVERCPLWLWEKAILDSYAVFRQLRILRKGVVVADLETRAIGFSALP
jgi:NTP pyrophosphatase (non-canonical NTP hydrolase)